MFFYIICFVSHSHLGVCLFGEPPSLRSKCRCYTSQFMEKRLGRLAGDTETHTHTQQTTKQLTQWVEAGGSSRSNQPELEQKCIRGRKVRGRGFGLAVCYVFIFCHPCAASTGCPTVMFAGYYLLTNEYFIMNRRTEFIININKYWNVCALQSCKVVVLHAAEPV